MPSDPRASGAVDAAVAQAALDAVAGAFSTYRSAVAATAEDVRGLLGRNAPPDSAATALGAFAAGRIDAGRFAAAVEGARTHGAPAFDAASLAALRACAYALSRLANASASETVVVRVPPGGRLRDVVATALAALGTAFAAARVAASAREGRSDPAATASGIGPLEHARWTRRERALAPPLVVEVDGADCQACALAEFLDGTQKIVLVVRGAAAPAPLARLVTPGTYVLQTGDAAGLDAFAAAPGPGIAAVVPDGAWFVHDPAAGPVPSERVVVRRVPDSQPRIAVGGISAAQQAEDLKHLAALARKAARFDAARHGAGSVAEPGGAPVAAPPAESDPAGRLAAYLLETVDLRDLG